MFILKAEAEFDGAHFLKGYDGKCKNIHGHRWRVVAEVASEKLQSEGPFEGMVVDFGDIKRDLKMVVDRYDHVLIYQKNTLKPLTIEALKEEGFKMEEVDFRPTAEAFSYHFFQLLSKNFYQVKRVTVYETPTNCAVYEV
ncbi:MAG: 6-carboxytetrahydropterin synthase [Clostridia bacterium]|nr:6-carboxytetrahydropterin synthase [Clostridia bacterium]